MSSSATPRVPGPALDDRSDVAAIVYRDADAADALLAAFLRDLRAQGFDVAGIVQERAPGRSGDGAPVGFRLVSPLLPGGDERETACPVLAGMDSRDIVRRLAEHLGRLIERRPDLVVLNRFGWLELNGAGLLDALRLAVGRDVPVVIAVPEALFPQWLDLAGGMAVKLPCERSALDRWWSALWRAPSVRRTTTCERDK